MGQHVVGVDAEGFFEASDGPGAILLKVQQSAAEVMRQHEIGIEFEGSVIVAGGTARSPRSISTVPRFV